MSDFSFFSLFTAGLACLLPLTSAYTQPTGSGPEGNPIYTPGLDQVVPVGTPFQITWDPTTPQDTVTLVLLKGPSDNAVPQYPIVEKIPNTGSYSWTPATDLIPTGNSGYGIQLIDDATGAYQYSTQFGISNPNPVAVSSATTSAPSYGSSAIATGYTSSGSSTSALPSSYASGYVSASASFSGWPTLSSASYPASVYSQPASGGWLPSGVWTHAASYPLVKPTQWLGGAKNGTTMAHSTGYKTTPYLKPTGTGSAPLTSQTGNAAVKNLGSGFAGLLVAGGVAVLAM